MHVVSMVPLRAFWKKHPQAEQPLRAWYKDMNRDNYRTPQELKDRYASVDQVGQYTVFDIGGNKFRLVVIILYDKGRIFVRHVMTHEEYDFWSKQHRKGKV